jgi:MFS family permease
MKYSHPLLRTLRSLRGNQRACVVTEPLWAIPSNLFLPFASIYMAAVGLNDRQIGFTVSLGLALQLVWGLLSGAITDKYGRRNMMLFFWIAQLGGSLPAVGDCTVLSLFSGGNIF